MDSVEASVGRADDLLKLVSDIVAAYVSHNPVPASELPSMIKSVHATLGGLANGGGTSDGATDKERTVPIKKSITPTYLVCLEDGKKLKMLKRYLRSRYNLTPDQYRTKWGLPADYPMVAADYSARRSDFAKKIGLGRKMVPKARRR